MYIQDCFKLLVPISDAFPISCTLLTCVGFDTVSVCGGFPTFTSFAIPVSFPIHNFLDPVCGLFHTGKFL